MSRLEKNLEAKIKKEVLKILEKGRPGWDVPHTLACVHWMKELIKKEGGNPRILIPAIYMHDIGYPDTVLKFNPKKNVDMKIEHMKKGAALAKKILNSIGGFKDSEIEEIFSIISIHDAIYLFRKGATKHEQLVFEADSLGQIDVSRVKPTFSKADRKKFLNRFRKNRATLFRTETGLRLLKELLAVAEKEFG